MNMKTISKNPIQLMSRMIVLTSCLFLFSCDKSDSQEDTIVINEEAQQFFYDVNEELTSFIEANNDCTFDDVILYLEKYGEDVKSEIKDSVLYVYLPDEYKITIDFYSKIIKNDNNEIEDNSNFDSFLKELDKNLCFYDSSDNTRALSSKEDSRGCPTRSFWSSDIKRSILIWDVNSLTSTYHVNRLNSLKEKLEERGLRSFKIADPKVGPDCTLESMKTFSDYGIVIFIAHGTEDGQLCYPKRYMPDDLLNELNTKESVLHSHHHGDFDAEGNKLYLYWVLNPIHLNLKKYLLDMKKTVIVSGMCNGFNENNNSFYKAVEEKCAGFVGSTTETYTDTLFDLFDFWGFLFMTGESARLAGVYVTSSQFYPDYKYDFKKDVFIKYHIQEKAKIDKENSEAKLHLVSAEGTVNYNSINNTRSLILGDEQVGISLKNKNTGILKESIIDESNVTFEKKYEYLGLVHSIWKIKTEDLEPGTYEYRTYLEIDGEKEYSDEAYEFTVLDIKHLSCPDYNHPHLIDLGLPSGTKWLCCNLGAKRFIDSGIGCAWGVTESFVFGEDLLGEKARHKYKYSEYHGDGAFDEDIYTDIGSNISGTVYDAATHYNSTLRMPTKKDLEELIESCYFLSGPVYKSNGTQYKHYSRGSIAIGPNGNMIYLGDIFWTATLSDEESDEQPFLMRPRENGVSGCAYSFDGVDLTDSGYPLEEEVKILLHYIEGDEEDDNIYYLEGEEFYKPSIIPLKRFWQCKIRPVGR